MSCLGNSCASCASKICGAGEGSIRNRGVAEAREQTLSPPQGNFFEQLGRPKYVLAPMVDQSELPFRILARRYGTTLCYTPMINANSFVNSAAMRQEMMGSIPAEDRPLIAQLAGHDPQLLLKAARYVEHCCDAVDLNLGCPQHIAKRGRYGSYLLEEEDLVVEIVSTLASNLSIPVTCKIRLFRNDFERTLRLCKRLENAGCQLLTVHGRTRYQNKDLVGSCNWAAIARIKEELHIPVVANGGIATFEDVERCLAQTGVDGVMSSEAALENPALFCGNRDHEGHYVDQDRLAQEYLDLVEQYLSSGRKSTDADCPKCVKAHLFKFLFAGLQANVDLREQVANGPTTLASYRAVVAELRKRGWRQPRHHDAENYCRENAWYFRHRLAELKPQDCSRQEEEDRKPTEQDDAIDWTAHIFAEE